MFLNVLYFKNLYLKIFTIYVVGHGRVLDTDVPSYEQVIIFELQVARLQRFLIRVILIIIPTFFQK